MNPKRAITVSKFLSKYLRHAPADLGLTLQPGGWVEVPELLAACNRHGFPITAYELAAVVAGSDKQRFSFDDTGTRVRANQGHSVEVDLQLEPADPPPVLYHGTAEANRDVILRDGLSKMRRHHVHLSRDTPTALKVGSRHGKPVLLAIDAAAMVRDGFQFFVSANGVWLVDHVPPQYLRPIDAP
jgi:putative RNA 2'-phosphotransferase